MLRTEEEAVRALKAIDEALSNVTLTKSVNIFHAVGMVTQEIKHSAFLAWLLNPTAAHGMGNTFLNDFLNALFNYPAQSENKQLLPNQAILANSQIFTPHDLDNLLNAKDIEVATEKTLSGPESRIDIFIRSQSANTVLIIENKVFTSTHDDQLNRYESEISVFGGTQICVYLTPHGDIPTDVNGNYQQRWCIFSYERLIEMLKSRLCSLPATKQFYRLRFLLEDYIEMVDTALLKNNPALRSLCKDILRRHADAIELLNSYTDNVDDVYAYVANEWIPAHVPNVAEMEFKGKQLRFYTKPIADFYAKHNHPIKINPAYWAVTANLGSKDGPIVFGFGLGKNPDDEWTETDVTIRNMLDPDKKMGSRFCTLFTVELLSAEDRQNKFEEIKEQLDDRLAVFLKKLNAFEAELIKL